MNRPKRRGVERNRAWRWIMQAGPQAGQRRGMLVVLAALVAISAVWFTGNWQDLLSARVLGHFLAGGTAFWLALRAAAHSVQAIYGLGSLSEAQGFVWRAAFGGRLRTLNIRGGGLEWEQETKALVRVGGPGKVRLGMENAALFEHPGSQGHAFGPSERAQYLGGFERLRAVIDLRDQVLNLNTWARTRDGVLVQVEGARVVYSINRGEQEASLQVPHPFERQALQRLVYEQRVSKEDPSDRGANILTTQGEAFFEGQLQDYIAQFNLGELIANAGADDTATGGQLFLARDRIRAQFMAGLLQPAEEFGLQLHWMDIGAWFLAGPAQAALEENLEVPVGASEASEASPYQDSRQQALLRLYESLPIWRLDLANQRTVLRQAISGYRQLFASLLQRFEEARGEDEKHFDAVARFLGVLQAQSGGGQDGAG